MSVKNYKKKSDGTLELRYEVYTKSEVDTNFAKKTDIPTVPTVNNGTLSIQGNGTTASTFTANQSGSTTLNIKGSGGTTVSKSANNEITISTGSIPTVNNGTLTIKAAGTSKGTFTANQSGNTTIDITAADLGLSSAMKFIGTSATAITDGATTNPITIGSTSTTVTAGNVVLYGAKEFVWTGSAWEELGNEGSYALSSVTVTGTGALGGGGAISANRTITHNELNTSGAQGTAKVFKTTLDKYGHVLSATAATYSDVGACASDDSRLSNARTPTSHASSGTSYGVGTSSNYGHVKLGAANQNGATAADGVAAPNGHTHSQYLTGITSSQVTTALGYTPGTSNFTGYTSSNKLSTSYIQNDAGWTSNTGNVTGSSLTADQLILGNGSSAIKVSSYKPTGSGTTWSTSSDVNLPTMKAISSYVTGLGYTSNAGTVTSVDNLSPSSGNVALNAVKYVQQSLTTEQKSLARSNIGAGTSSFSGSYANLTNVPSIITKIGAVSVDDTSTGYIRFENGVASLSSSSAAPSNMVTTDTTQTISGSKTFSSTILPSGTVNVGGYSSGKHFDKGYFSTYLVVGAGTQYDENYMVARYYRDGIKSYSSTSTSGGYVSFGFGTPPTSGSRNITLPTKAGTVALTSDITVQKPRYASRQIVSASSNSTVISYTGYSTLPSTNAKYYRAPDDGIFWFSTNNDANISRTFYVYPYGSTGNAWLTFTNAHNGYGTAGGYQIRVAKNDFVGVVMSNGGAVTVNYFYFIPIY